MEQPHHLLGPLQVAVGVTLATKAHVVDRGMLADARHHVLQHPPVRRGEQHIVRRHVAYPRGRGHVAKLMKSQGVARAPAQGERHVGPVAEEVREAAKL